MLIFVLASLIFTPKSQYRIIKPIVSRWLQIGINPKVIRDAAQHRWTILRHSLPRRRRQQQWFSSPLVHPYSTLTSYTVSATILIFLKHISLGTKAEWLSTFSLLTLVATKLGQARYEILLRELVFAFIYITVVILNTMKNVKYARLSNGRAMVARGSGWFDCD